MKLNVKTFAILSFLGAFLLGMNISPAMATTTNSSSVPTIKVKKIKKTSVTLNVSYPSFKKTKVDIRIQIENDDEDTTSSKTVRTTLNSSGQATINVGSLDSGTNYIFKAGIKTTDKRAYSDYSSGAKAATTGSDYEPSIETIKNITDDSVKLDIYCDDLDNKAVNVQVAYKKKSSWSKSDFTLTLDGDGEGTVQVNGLKSDTSYSFKIRIKKSGDDTYSTYSSIKKATTDN